MSLPRKQSCWAISNISNGEQWSVVSTALASLPEGGGNRLAFVRSVFRISLAVAVIFVADRGRLRIQFGQLYRCARDIFESIPLVLLPHLHARFRANNGLSTSRERLRNSANFGHPNRKINPLSGYFSLAICLLDYSSFSSSVRKWMDPSLHTKQICLLSIAPDRTQTRKLAARARALAGRKNQA
ncbi:MAG: hypothetical protein ACI915_003644 [Gammaproteobacteria bacterium]|jgi:hypothetical protein